MVFEELMHNGKVIANHEELDDEDQTVHFPKVTTSASITELGIDKRTVVWEKGKIITPVDLSKYENVLPEKEYVIKGVIMDPATGKQLEIDGKTYEAEKTFTAEESSGSILMEFEGIDITELKNKDIVFYEYLYYNDVIVGSHEDITDPYQTIKIIDDIGYVEMNDNPLFGGTVRTGDTSMIIIPIILAIIAILAGGTAAILRRRDPKSDNKGE